ncbi:apolipophorins [Pituophis catenifer annectens]|uniref:apolipophorins n=1 Tax=Pituophis catenifer annectens TaxID=94852 RepID=UPI003994D042
MVRLHKQGTGEEPCISVDSTYMRKARTCLALRDPENFRHRYSCSSQCAGFSTPTVSVGSRFSYSYSTSTTTFLQGRAYQRGGITLESTVVVEVLANCRRILKLQGVQIKNIFESEKEEGTGGTNQCNIPITMSVDISGKCRTQYRQKGSVLLKMKDFNLCSHHFSGFTSLKSVALPNASEQLLSSKLECIQRFEEKGILAEIKCMEYHLVTPPARKGSGVKMQTRTDLKLFRTEAHSISQEKVPTSDIYESSLLYQKEKMAPLSKEEEMEEVANVLQKLCVKSTMDTEPTDLFLNLVFALRQVSTDALMDLWKSPSSKCQDNWRPLLDALPFCATEPCVVLMEKLILLQEVDEDHIDRFLRSLAFIPEPTAGMMDALAPLLELPKERQIAFLGLTSLLHHFCSTRTNCNQVPAVLRIMKILGRHLGGKCARSKSEGTAQMELILNAIGNAGLAATSLTTLLSSCAVLKTNPTEIRQAAIEAFRRIPCAANRAVLLRLFQTYDENVEIRIASYLMAMKCPSKDLFHHIKWTLQEERSSQVGSFVWSHLSELLRTEDPLKQHLRNSLPEDIILKEFDWETWKFSSYTDVTFNSAMASGNAEAQVIFSPASFIPRLILTNFTIHLLGRAINLLEVGVRLENMEDIVRTFFDFQDTKGRHVKPESPMQMVNKIPQNKPSFKQFNLKSHLPKGNKTALRTESDCPRGQYQKINGFVKKFTKKMGKKKKPKCKLSLKIFGNELMILDCGDLRSQAKHYYLNLAELTMKVLKGQEVQWNKRLSLATEEVLFPTISGLPVLLGFNASAAVNLTARGDTNFKKHNHFFINGYLKPSIILQISAQMGTVGVLGNAGLKWSTILRSSAKLDGGIQVKKGKEFKFFWNTPEDAMEILHFSSKLYITAREKTKTNDHFPGQTELCTSEEASKTFGWQLCSEVFLPDEKTSSFVLPFPGPVKVVIMLRKQDRNLQQYLIKAAYHYVAQKGSWIPNEAELHFFMGSPESELKRNVAFDFHWNIPQKKIRIEFIEPKTKMLLNGKIEISKYSRVGHLELIVNDNTIYYIKGRTDLQSVAGEQRYAIRLEAKLLRHGSPVVLAGNLTRLASQKVAFSVSLINLLKDAASFAVCFEKKADNDLRHYSLDGETHIPGVFGSHVIFLLQKRGQVWSNILRIKYGLFGDAKKLQHECNMAQRLKQENSWPDVYRLDLEHKFHCTQSLTYNHKVHLHHEDTASQLHSRLEANYGKHWDEANNMRKVIISQMFKNHSQATLRNYFMEFMIQVPEKNLDYRTRLQHSGSFHPSLESSTSFKVHYNNRILFIADLQWKNVSGRLLKKWEGTFNMDTPWLYLYATHKFHQFQRSAFFTTVELTVGKAFVLKGLILELYCKDNNAEKEGRVEIRTSTTTYLRASTINRFMKGFLHSQNEIMSLWSQLIKHEVLLENNEHTKFLRFRLTSAKKEFNLTASYCHLEVPRKSNISTSVVWTDHKNLPLVLRFEAQLEEVKKEKMLYQKRGTLLFRHPLNLPFPQSLLLQETFTVNKKEKHYSLETRLVIDEREDSILTLTLGYPTKNPHICARLTHPYNSGIFPQNTEACIMVRNLTQANQELEVKLKISQEEVLSFLGKYQNKSSMGQSRHLIQLDITHSFQAQASLNCHGQNGLNGSFDLHTSTRNLMFLEANFDNEMKRNTRAFRVSAALKQDILEQFKYVELQFLSKETPSRLLLTSSVKLNQHSFQVGISGSKEQKAGVVTLRGYVQHNLESIRLIVPQDLSLNSSLKHRINFNEGLVTIAVNRSIFSIHVRSKCLCGNESFYSMMVAVTQDGRDIFLAQGKLKGSPEPKRRIQRDEVHVPKGARGLCVGLANIFLQSEVGFTGTFTHNISSFYVAGLPTESSIKTMYGHNNTYQRVTADLQGGNQKISVIFGVEKLHPEALQTQLANHSLEASLRTLLHGPDVVNNSAPSVIREIFLNSSFAPLCIHTACNLEYVLETSFNHAWPYLTSLGLAQENRVKMAITRGDPHRVLLEITLGNDLGLPRKNLILLIMTGNAGVEGLLVLHVGKCKLEIQGETQAKAKMEWTLEMEMACKALQDRGFPNHAQLNGSLLKDDGQLEFFNSLQVEGQGASFTVSTKCQPKFILEVELRHGLSFFNRIPKENKLIVHCGKRLKRAINLEVKSGLCQLQANLEMDAGNGSQWQAVMENSCKMIQTRGEFHALLDQRIKGAINSGIPARTEVDLISEKSRIFCERLLQFKVDGQQVLVSSSLKRGRARIAYSATVAHPFNFAMKHMEVSSLTQSRKGTYAQQLKNILTIASLRACGSLKQTTAMLNQHLDLTWDNKTVVQHLTYETNRVLHRDKIMVEATLKNLLMISCSHQRILGEVETDYAAWLNYNTRLWMCELPNAVALSGKLQLSQGDTVFRSEGKISLGGNNEGTITVALQNNSKLETRNYSAEFSLKGSEATWMDVKACVTSSADESQVFVEGKMDHPNEKVKITAIKGKECLRYYMGYLKGNSEDALEFAACMKGQKQAALNARLVVNRREEMGHLTMEASNQSLDLKAHGCWDLVMKTESKLGEITSDLWHRLVEKIKKLEEHIQDFRKSIRHIGFLYDAVGWSLEASQEMVRLLHGSTSQAAQMWEQSGFKRLLRDQLPMYLRKFQSILQQVQLELQKPLTTLKDAYYDVTLKPLDEVWQQKTDAYLKKLQALVPTVVKDATQQILNWAEAKLSRMLSRLQKSISNLYRFSARNCSVALSLPVVPKGEATLDLINLTNRVIEEKVIKPLRGLYHINLAAEYYKFKRAIMESPFEHQALLMGTKHLWTFDGKMYSLTSNCSLLLAKDFSQNAFTVILNQSSGADRSLYLNMKKTVVIIYPEQKIFKQYNTSLLKDCGSFDVPLQENGTIVQVDTNHVEMATADGALFFCDLRYNFCTFTLDGWHHGVSAGLFGTNDNEAGNEWMLPDHSLAKSLSEFIQAWQVNSRCSEVMRDDKSCVSQQSAEICQIFFQDSASPFRNCFGVVNPEPFYHWCKTDLCELQSIKVACNLAAAFRHLCNRNFVPIEMPLQCGAAKNSGQLAIRTLDQPPRKVSSPNKEAVVVEEARLGPGPLKEGKQG